MTWRAYGYDFEGPFYSSDKIPAYPGVYTVWCITDKGNYLLDVGQAENLHERIVNHDRKDCWKRNCYGQTAYYLAKEYSEQARLNLEKRIREEHKPPCGEK
ncbi:MAG: GIY-YIG nuclease family protein [Candidatus Aminicenantes bacterium]|nr:GIY-YIG nuclease family protein [Candidatus Aminicenantes bacterium]